MSILDEIFAHKRAELATSKQALPEAELERRAMATPIPSNFVAALQDPARTAPRLIAEVKKRSPSKGLLRPNFDPLNLAQAYVANGATAISVLTDSHYFGGSLQHLQQIARLDRGMPLLRKDFIFDRFQLLEARTHGASAALLITAMLAPADLQQLILAAHDLDLTPLVEVHTRKELEIALDVGATLIGINNRDLHTFQTSLAVTEALRPHVPDGVTLVSESGIRTTEDVVLLAELEVAAMLIGEAIVTAEDVATKVRLFSQSEISPA